MDCKEFRELLDRYESIDELDRECMDAHCELCDECRSEMEFFKSIISVSASIPCPQPPKMLIDEVNAKLDGEAKASKLYLSRGAKRGYATIAACLAVGIAVGINGGYIKDHLEGDNDNGVISETVVVTESNDATANESKDAPVVTPDAEKVTSKAEKDDKKPASSNTSKEKAEPATVAKPTVSPIVETVAPVTEKKDDAYTIEHGDYRVPEKDDTHNVIDSENSNLNDYMPVVEGSHVAMAQYSVGTYGLERNLKADYILVSDRDMGAVVSIISEYGVSSSNGQFTTELSNFYQILARFDAEGIDYDYRLMYTYGNVVSFEVRYHTGN